MYNIAALRPYRWGSWNSSLSLRDDKYNELEHIDNMFIECIALQYSDPTGEAPGTLLYLWILGNDKYNEIQHIDHNIYWMHNIVLSDPTREAATLLIFQFSEIIWDAFKSLF